MIIIKCGRKKIKLPIEKHLLLRLIYNCSAPVTRNGFYGNETHDISDDDAKNYFKPWYIFCCFWKVEPTLNITTLKLGVHKIPRQIHIDFSKKTIDITEWVQIHNYTNPIESLRNLGEFGKEFAGEFAKAILFETSIVPTIVGEILKKTCSIQ